MVVEQIIVLRNPSKSAPKKFAYQVIIVPTAATGASPLVRSSPDFISFNWPDKKADEHLGGTIGEAADRENDTYLSVFNRVFNEELSAFGKSVLSLPDQSEEEYQLNCSTTLRFRKARNDKDTETKGL